MCTPINERFSVGTSPFICFFLIQKVLSSSLLPNLLRPSLFSTMRGSVTFLPKYDQGSPFTYLFYDVFQQLLDIREGRLPRVRHSSLSVCCPTSHWFVSPDIGPRLCQTARPTHQRHLVGSLSATYTDSTSCFLQTTHFW